MSVPTQLATESTLLSPTGSWLWLIQMPVSDSQTIYLTNNNASVTFDSIVYNPADVSVGSLTEGSEGVTPEAGLTIGNASLFLSTLAAYRGIDGMVGRRVTLIRVHSAHLGTSTAKISIRFWVRAATVSESSNSVSLQLGLDQLFGANIPIEFFSRTKCRFGYKSAECGYSSQSATITGATNASPIVITTSAPHRFVDDSVGVISSVGGNTAANGTWTFSVIDAFTFSLDGSTGSGAYTSGGSASVSLPTCDRTLNGPNGCLAHNNNERFGGVPAIPRNRTI